MRLDPLFSLLTLPPLVKLLCVSYWSIFCNRIVVSVLTSSHSSHTIASHVSPWKEKSCSSHIWVRESYLWYPFLLFPSLYELTERNNFIFFKRDAIALPLRYDHVSTCESDPLLLPRAPKSLCSRYVHSIFVDTVEIILWITDEELWITILQSPWRISSAFEVLVVWPYTIDAKVTSTMMRVSNTNFIFRLQNHC